MSLPQGNKQEELQRAWFRAVVAKAGANFAILNWDNGIDFYITATKMSSRGTIIPTSNIVICQLKSSKNCEIRENDVVYKLDAEAYNKLAELEDSLAILLLLHLPEKEEDWLTVDDCALCIRYCCYWLEVPNEVTQKTSKITVKIPKHQVFDPQAVHELLDRARQDVRKNRG